MSSEQLTGRDLDAAIVAKLFGWRWVAYTGVRSGDTEPTRQRKCLPPEWNNPPWDAHWRAMDASECTGAEMSLPVCKSSSVPRYSESWDAMRLVIEAMLARGIAFGCTIEGDTAWASFRMVGVRANSSADLLPVAVCEAALAVLMHESELREASEGG